MKRVLKKLILTFTLVFVFAILFGSMCLYSATDGTLIFPDGNDDPYENLTSGGFEVVGPCEHEMGEWYIVEPGSCNTNRIEERVCIYDCGGKEIRLTMNGVHDISVYVPGSPATCTHSTVRPYWKCSLCGMSEDSINGIYGTPAPDNLGHNFTEQIIDEAHLRTAATCVVPATYYYDCSRTGYQADDGVECKIISEENYFYYGEELGHKDENSDNICDVCASYVTCGDNLTWDFDFESGTLSILGEGAIRDFTTTNPAPWFIIKDLIHRLEINFGVTTIGNYAFYKSGIKSVVLPKSVTNIRKCAFNSCTDLTDVVIPVSVKSIGGGIGLGLGSTDVFYGCSKLEFVHYCGSNEQWRDVAIGINCFPIELFEFKRIHYNSEIVEVDSSCTPDGPLQGINCPNCGYIYLGKTESEKHILGDWFTKVSPTISKIGVKIRNCHSCDYYETGEIPIVNNISGDCGKNGDNVTWILNSEGLLRISGTGEMADFVYESSPWYTDNSVIKKIVIENGVTYIGKYSFQDCVNLTEVVFPDNLVSIGAYSFEACTSLETISIPDSVEVIGSDAFADCKKLINVTLGSGLKELGDFAFTKCISLKSVYIPDGVEKIGVNVFCYAKNLESVNIPDTVKTAFDDSFVLGTKLHNNTSNWEDGVLYIDKHLIDVDENAVGECTIKESTLTICENAFQSSKFTKISIPASVVSIGSDAFIATSNLAEIIVSENNQFYSSDEFGVLFNKDKTKLIRYPIGSLAVSYSVPDSVTCIIQDAFHYAKNLESVDIGKNVVNIGSCAFKSCIGLVGELIIPEKVEIINMDAFYDCTGITKVRFPDNVKIIGSYSFYNCTSLTDITIHDNVIRIGAAAFYNTGYYNDSTNWEDNVLYIDNHLIESNSDNISGHFNIKDGTVTVSAFDNCEKLESVYIPETVKTIDALAFIWCESLTKIRIPDSVIYINDSTLRNCDNLTKVEILNKDCEIYDDQYTISHTATIYGYAGSTAEAYAEKYDREFIPIIAHGKCGEKSRWILHSTGELIIYGYGSMNDYKVNKYAPWYPYRDSIKTVTFENAITSIGDLSFYECKNVADIQLPDSIERIGKYAFNGCDSLTSIYIPVGVNAIDSKAFHSCNALAEFVVSTDNGSYTSLDGVLYNKDMSELVKYPLAKDDVEFIIPETVFSIAESAFNGCEYLTEISVDQNIEIIKDSAFYNCKNLETVYLGESVKTIEPYAFYNCQALTAISFANSDITIGDWAFYKCNGLDEVNYAGSMEEWSLYNFGNDNKPLKKVSVNCEINGASAEPASIMMFGMRRTVQEHEHNYESVTFTPTCTNAGYTVYTCSGCGDSYRGDETVALGHTEITISGKASTCFEEGLTDGVKCEDCGELIIVQEKINKLEHVDSNDDSKCDYGCGFEFFDSYTSTENSNGCDCYCHKSGFIGFIWKVIIFFNKLFGMNKTCACDVTHY